METTAVFANYRTEDTVEAELNNNLTIINCIVDTKKLNSKPVFYILGGAAMVFHGLNYKSTLDIDTANRLSTELMEQVSEFIDDGASMVSLLPNNYVSRAIRIREDLTNIEVYILSLEDLLITKLHCGRRKDFKAIHDTKLLHKVNKVLLQKIIATELVKQDSEQITIQLNYYMSVFGE